MHIKSQGAVMIKIAEGPKFQLKREKKGAERSEAKNKIQCDIEIVKI